MTTDASSVTGYAKTKSRSPVKPKPPFSAAAPSSRATSAEAVAWTAERLQNESYPAYLSMALRWPRPGRASSPVTVVAAELDGVFTLAEQRALASAYGTDLVTLAGMGHDAMLDDGAEDAADLVAGLIAG